MKSSARTIIAAMALPLSGFATSGGLGPGGAYLTAQSRSPGLESVWAAAGFGAAIAIGDGEIFVGRTGGGIAGRDLSLARERPCLRARR